MAELQEFYSDLSKQNLKLEFLTHKLAYIEVLENESEINELKKEIKELETEINEKVSLFRQDDISKYLNEFIYDDCRNILPFLPENSVHAVISDIPYGINHDEWDIFHNNTNSALLGTSPAQKGKSAFKRRGKPINGWNKDDRNMNKYYEEWVFQWAQMLFPVLKEGAPIFIFGGRRTISSAVTAFERAGFLVKDMLAWEKQNAHHRSQDIFKVLIKRGASYEMNKDVTAWLNAQGISAKKADKKTFDNWRDFIKYIKSNYMSQITTDEQYEVMELGLSDPVVSDQVNRWKGWKLGNLAPYFEPIMWFMKPYDSVNTLTDNVLTNEVGAMNIEATKNDGVEPKNILPFDFSDEEKSNRAHEAQKPLELIEFLLTLSTQEEQIILDPFSGSGTTALACKHLNRRHISIEIDKKWHDTAVERV